MLAVLVLKACLVAAPTRCEVHELETGMAQLSCLRWGQALAAKWSEAHPGWRIARLGCRTGVPA